MKLSKTKLPHYVVILIELGVTVVLIFTAFWLFNDNTHFLNDYYVKNSWRGWELGWIHQGFRALSILGILTMAFLLIWEFIALLDTDINPPFNKFIIDKDSNTVYHGSSHEDENEETNKQFNMKINWRKLIKWAVIVFLVVVVFRFGRTIFTQSVFMFNTSKLYHNTYQQKVEEKLGFYDKLWKTYLQKDKITNVNKETFIEVTKILMEGRSDGEQVTWKWLQENQPVPYTEFTVFYKDLSDFITGQREGYFAIEKQCQVIARQNNTLLDTFPNNVYNRMLKIERIIFEYGFLSDSTNAVFASGIENVE